MAVPIMQSNRIKVEKHRNMSYLEIKSEISRFSTGKVDMIGFINIYLINNWLFIVSMCHVHVNGSQ